MNTHRHVRLFRIGRNQVLRIPRVFELPGDAVTIHKVGDRLVIAPVKTRNLRDVLVTLKPVAETFPNVDAGLAPLDDVKPV